MICNRCGEEILEGRRCNHFAEGIDLHHECGSRAVVGSVGHILGICSCFGGTLEDPPGMSMRAAAQAAMRVFMLSRKHGTLPDEVRLALATHFFLGEGLRAMRRRIFGDPLRVIRARRHPRPGGGGVDRARPPRHRQAESGTPLPIHHLSKVQQEVFQSQRRAA